MRGKNTIAAAAAILGALALAGVAAASVTPPPAIKSAGQIVFCTDATYPPEESIPTGSTKPVGSDIDIGSAAAAQMGVKATFKNTTFDSIIAALKAKKCDAVISGMNDTPDRRKQVDFVDYLKVGQSIMVKAGNPEHITSLASLSGKNIGDLLSAQGVTWGWFQGGFRPTSRAGGKTVCGAAHRIDGQLIPDYIPHHEPFQYYASTANPHHLPPTSVAMIGRTDRANHGRWRADRRRGQSAGPSE